MAFNAGAIEATLTLNRNPFTAGLKAAQAEARAFAAKDIKAQIKPVVDSTAMDRIKASMEKLAGRMTIRPMLDNQKMRDVKAQIERQVSSIKVRVQLDRESLTAVKARIENTSTKIKVGLNLDQASLAALRARLSGMSANISIKLRIGAGEIAALRAQLATLGHGTIDVRTRGGGDANGMLNTLKQIPNAAKNASSGLLNLGESGTGAFRRVHGAARAFIMFLPALLPILGSVVTAAVGMIGGLVSILGTAGSGILAFGGVAAGVFNKIKDYSADAAKSVKAGATAYKAVEAAQEDLRKTTADVAKDNITATKQVQDAEESRKGAVRDLEDAQLKLNEAIRGAKQDMEDLKLSLRDGALDEEEALLRLQKAQEKLAEARAKGVTGTDMKELVLDVKRAELGLDQARSRYGELKAESDNFAKNGVMGSQQVRDAVRGVEDATVKVKSADKDVADAKANQTAVAQEGLARIAEANAKVAEANAEYVKATQAGGAAISAAMMVAATALDNVKRGYDDLIKRTEVPVSNAMASVFDAATAALKTLDPIVVAAAGAFERAGATMEAFFSSPRWKQFVDFLAANVGPNLDEIFRIMGLGAIVIMNLVEAFDPLADWMLDAMVQGMEDLAKWTGELKNSPEFMEFLAQVKESAPRVLDFIGKLLEFGFKLSVALAPIGDAFLGVLTKFLDWVNSLDPEVLQAVAIGIASIMTALMLGASPQVALAIGIIAGIATGFDNLYKSSEPLRALVTKITDHIEQKWVPKFKEMWEQIKEKVGPALEDLKKTFDEKLVPALERFWTKAEPIWDKVVDVLTVVIPWALEFLVRAFDGAVTALSGILDFFGGLFTGDWSQMWTGIQEIFEGILKVIAGIFGLSLDELKQVFFGWAADLIIAWTLFWQDIGKRFSEFGENTKKEWDAVTGWISTKWNEFTKWLGDGWTNFWADIGKRFSEFGQRIKDDWNGFWAAVGDAWTVFTTWLGLKWDEFWAKITDYFARKRDELVAGTMKMVADLDKAWRDVANIFRTPINWVIEQVINEGVLKGWNTVMGWIGADLLTVDKLPPIPQFAKGGPVVGYGGVANKDSVPAMLMPGELVFSKKAIANMGGLGAVDAMHRQARDGRIAGAQTAQSLMRTVPMMDDGNIRGFAYGGVQPHVAAAGQEIERIFGPMPGGIGGVGSRPNASDHPSGHALDFMTMNNQALGNRVKDYLSMNAARMLVKYLIFKQQINSGNGWQGMEDRGSPTANHMDHVHASFLRGNANGRNYNNGGFNDAGGGTFGSMWDSFGADILGLFNGLSNDRSGIPGGAIGNGIAQLPLKLIEKVLGKVQEKAMSIFTSGTGDTGVGPTADRAVAQAAVRKVAANYGWDNGGQWANLLQLINKESSWDPSAANPTSTARGLFQKMTSIWGPVEPTVEGQAQWGLKYIKDRYGDPTSAWAFHRRNNFYDQGGMVQPGGGTLVNNTTNRPERVLAAKDTENFGFLVAALEQILSNQGQEPVNVNVYPREGQSEEGIAASLQRRLENERRLT